MLDKGAIGKEAVASELLMRWKKLLVRDEMEKNSA